MDIKTFKKYFRKIAWDYWAMIIIFSLFAFYFTFLYVKALYSGVPTEYSSYQNVNVEVKEATMEGKLNQHISIRHRNKYCYVLYCGFPKEGFYHLSDIEFIDIDGDVFIFKSCLSKGECFYNISDYFIGNIKDDKLQELKKLTYLGYFIIFYLFLFWDNSKRIKN